MPRKRTKQKESVSDRLQQLCETKFGGSARRMSEALGVSQAAGWRIISGKQASTGAFLAGLAALSDVDLNWVFRGAGDPPQADQTVALPIARELLPGLPQESSDRLTTETFGVSGSLYRDSRYWLEVQPDDPIVRYDPLNVAPGDLLLMDADRTAIPRGDQLDGDLVGVRVPTEQGPQFKLGLASYYLDDAEDGAAHLEADTFDLGVDPADVVREFVLREQPDGTLSAHRRTLMMVRDRRGLRPVPLGRFDAEPVCPTIAPNDILCVFILLVRRRLPREVV